MRIFLACTVQSMGAPHPPLCDYVARQHEMFLYLHALDSPNESYSFTSIAKEIEGCDVFIGEMSMSSQTLGFQLAYALQQSKPCLYLYDKSRKGRPAGLIGNIPSRALVIKGYEKEQYAGIIDNFLQFAQRQMASSRTSFMSTKEIDDFLASEARRLNISKGEVIRHTLHAAILAAGQKKYEQMLDSDHSE